MADGQHTFTEAEWTAKGEALFGPDKANWVFRCFMCGNEMSVARARAEFPQLKGTGWAPESECIGRYLDVPAAQAKGPGPKPRRCDWAAYGLIRGPWVVTAMRNGEPREYGVFEFGAPWRDPNAVADGGGI